MPLAATLSSLRQCTIPYIFKFPDIAPVVDNSLRKSFDSYIENCKSFFNFMFHICLINIPDTTSGLLMACLTIKDKSYVGILHFVHLKENPFLSFYRMYVMNQKKTFISASEIFSFLFLFFFCICLFTSLDFTFLRCNSRNLRMAFIFKVFPEISRYTQVQTF